MLSGHPVGGEGGGRAGGEGHCWNWHWCIACICADDIWMLFIIFRFASKLKEFCLPVLMCTITWLEPWFRRYYQNFRTVRTSLTRSLRLVHCVALCRTLFSCFSSDSPDFLSCGLQFHQETHPTVFIGVLSSSLLLRAHCTCCLTTECCSLSFITGKSWLMCGLSLLRYVSV